MFSYLKIWIGQLPTQKSAQILGGITGNVQSAQVTRDTKLSMGRQNETVGVSAFQSDDGSTFGQSTSYQSSYKPYDSGYSRDSSFGGRSAYDDVSVRASSVDVQASSFGGGYGGGYDSSSVRDSSQQGYGLGSRLAGFGGSYDKTSIKESETVEEQTSYSQGYGYGAASFGNSVQQSSNLNVDADRSYSSGAFGYGAAVQETSVQESETVADQTSYSRGYGYGGSYGDTAVQNTSVVAQSYDRAQGSFGGSYGDTSSVQVSETVEKQTSYDGAAYGGYGGKSYDDTSAQVSESVEKSTSYGDDTYGGYGGSYQDTSVQESQTEQTSFGQTGYGYGGSYDSTSVEASRTEQTSYGGGYGGSQGVSESFQKLTVDDVSAVSDQLI
jgi:hypothetical protein